jgi:hypothetical protein
MPKGLRNIQFSFEETALTHYGGMAVFQQFCRKLGLKRLFQTYVPWERRSISYHGAELLMCLIHTMVAGLKRVSDTKILAYNKSFQKLLGLPSFPAESTLREFLKGLSPKELRSIIKVHNLLRDRMRVLPSPSTSYILDLDSTVLPLYGWTIQGARIGYNPKKPKRPSYHPLVCFEGHTQDTIHGMLRPGDTQPITAAKKFFRACLAKLPEYANRKKVIVRLRADAGFYDGKFVRFLDGEKVGYVIVAKITAPIKEKAEWLTYRTFRQQGRWQVARTDYRPQGWKRPHHFIMVRRPKPEKAEEALQLTLWEFEDFFYHAFVSELRLKPAAVYRFYKGRANAELDFRELKESLPLGQIPTTSFTANAAHFELTLLAYDLVNWFRRLCLEGSWKTARLKTLRRELFMIPARLVSVDHRNVLRLPEGYPHRKRFRRALAGIQALRIR